MRDPRPRSFEDWVKAIPNAMRKDPLWGSIAYQKGLFLHDLCWFDCERLARDERGRKHVGQLIGSVGSISANMEEGFSKGFGADYARYLGIALGSARESRGWYWRVRCLLPSAVFKHRFELTSEIIALLLTTIPQQRQIKKKKPQNNRS